MIWAADERAKVYVVDACPQDYTTFVQRALREVAEVQFFACGRDALRANCHDSPAMWIVNLRLPDMDGTELQGVLRSKGCRGAIALVGDEYNIADEIAARCAGANLYLAKPVEDLPA